VPVALHAQPDSETPPTESGVLEVAYPAGLFYGVDINDARAATKVWVQRLIERNQEVAGSETIIYYDLASIEGAIRAKRVDLITLHPADYVKLRDRIELKPLAVAVSNGNVYERHGLITHRASSIKTLGQLRGKRLLIQTGGKGGLPDMWLDVQLRKQGLPPAKSFFGDVARVPGIGKAVLPVFFQNADACMLSLDAFGTMAEMNPQLEEELRPLITSPQYCKFLVCVRPDIYERKLHRYIDDSLTSLHTDPQGQQLLALFRVDKLVPFEQAHLDNVLALMQEFEALDSAAGGNP
jgi:ABC-type phosphate/phosphonate transport system substrate-binding protein